MADQPPPQTHARGQRRILDAAWLNYLTCNAPHIDTTPPPPPFDDAIAAFNEERFFESHEAFEVAWNGTNYPARLLCLALVKIATGFAHAQRRSGVGARRLLRDGLRLLAAFALPAWGVDTPRLANDVAAWMADGQVDAAYPRIHRTDASAQRSPEQTQR